MILAERLCLLALDQKTGRAYLALDRDRFLTALAGLVLADLIFAQRMHAEGEHLALAPSMPIAHPVLADAVRHLAGLGAPLTIADGLASLRRHAAGWQRRIHKGLVARDILELTTPFPFVRRHRPRSKQAWNECVEPLRALARNEVNDEAAAALALALQTSAILGEIVDASTARTLIARLPAPGPASASPAGTTSALLARMFATR
jgi:hypothetical protein